MGRGNRSMLEMLKQEIATQVEDQDEVLELTFEDFPIKQFTPEMAELFKQYDQLISLDFNGCELENLDNFPKIPSLIKLSLESNKLNGHCIQTIIENFPSLQFLSMSGNQIESLNVNKDQSLFISIQELKTLGKLENLIQLDFSDNEASTINNYRPTIYQACKKLEILDNKDADGNSIEYSSDLDENIDLDDIDADELDEEDEDEEEDVEEAPRKQRKPN